jgi:hypothetical protein
VLLSEILHTGSAIGVTARPARLLPALAADAAPSADGFLEQLAKQKDFPAPPATKANVRPLLNPEQNKLPSQLIVEGRVSQGISAPEAGRVFALSSEIPARPSIEEGQHMPERGVIKPRERAANSAQSSESSPLHPGAVPGLAVPAVDVREPALAPASVVRAATAPIAAPGDPVPVANVSGHSPDERRLDSSALSLDRAVDRTVAGRWAEGKADRAATAGDLAFSAVIRQSAAQSIASLRPAVLLSPRDSAVGQAKSSDRPAPVELAASGDAKPAEPAGVSPRIVSALKSITTPGEDPRRGKAVAPEPVTIGSGSPGEPRGLQSLPPEAAPVAGSQVPLAPSTPAVHRADVAPSYVLPPSPEPPPDSSAPGHGVLLRIDGREGQKPVEVRVSERGGELRVAVHSPDRELARGLQTGLSELTARLSRSGYSTTTWHPRMESSSHGLPGNGRSDSQDSSRGESQSQSGDPQAQHRRNPQSKTQRWLEDMEAPPASQPLNKGVKDGIGN